MQLLTTTTIALPSSSSHDPGSPSITFFSPTHRPRRSPPSPQILSLARAPGDGPELHRSSSGDGLQLQCRECPNAAQFPMRFHKNHELLASAQNGRDDSLQRFSASPSSSILFSAIPLIYPSLAENTGYSQASYFTSLGLFVLSVPGVWSLIKRSTKSKIVQKTFIVPGPSAEKGKPLSQIAGEITSFFTRSNFVVADRGETVTFEGIMTPSRGQAAFLTFCTCISLASVALVLTITVPDVGDKWYWLSALSPLAGVYYWTRASRKEQIKVKMVVSDDEVSTDVIVQGDDEQVDRLRKELGFMEKGMVYVKGILER